MPVPAFEKKAETWFRKTMSHFALQAMYDATALTMEDLINAVCASNYEALIDNKNIRNRYEIYAAVSGITVDKAGVDYYEIRPEKSFVNDLGMD